MTATWTGAAEVTAADARHLGFDVADTVASAWQARCDPEATRALVQAVMALTSGEGMPLLWAKADPCPAESEFLTAVEDHEAHAVVLASRASDLAGRCEAARESALAEHASAQQAAQAGIAAAVEAARQMRQVIADCEAALEIITAVRERLLYAIGCFRRAPAEYEAWYEIAIQHVRDGGRLPWSGDFFTGATRAA